MGILPMDQSMTVFSFSVSRRFMNGFWKTLSGKKRKEGRVH